MTSTIDRRLNPSHVNALVDEMLARYVAWREDAAAVSEMYARWSNAPRIEKSRRFSACMTALDHEASSARRYAEAVSELAEHLAMGCSL